MIHLHKLIISEYIVIFELASEKKEIKNKTYNTFIFDNKCIISISSNIHKLCTF